MIPRLLGRREAEYDPDRPVDAQRRAIDMGHNRLIVTGMLFLLAFGVIGARMAELMLFKGDESPRRPAAAARATEPALPRADIVDRNGVLLATSLPTVSLYAIPGQILDADEAAAKLAGVLPELGIPELRARLKSDRGFVYLRRNLTPRQQYEVNALGLPGINFERGARRVYPEGALSAHAVGLTDLDGHGIAGIEKTFDGQLGEGRQPIRLALDLRIQTVVRTELARAIAEFRAIGATGMVMDVTTGELLAMVSLPDYDPNQLAQTASETMFNRATLGVYEMGSTFKLFNTAAALDTGTATPNSMFDASGPLHVARFEITDTHPFHRALSVREILVHSSNVGSAHMAMAMGTENQRNYMARFGMLRAAAIELPEVGAPLFPAPWREINTMTIAYGHGIAVTPLQLITGVSSLVNGGVYRQATLLRNDPGTTVPERQVIKRETSEQMRRLMRAVVEEGTGSKANVPGYEVGGKTGTAEKVAAGGYRHKALLSSFIATFPVSDPKYVVLVMVDEPQGTRETAGFATGGWTAAPAAGRVIAQMATILGIPPADEDDEPIAAKVAKTAIVKEPKVAAATE